MGFPQNRHEMIRAHYSFVKNEPCPKCGVNTQLWETRAGEFFRITNHPLDTDRTNVKPHWQECKPRDTKSDERQSAIDALARKLGARIVVATFEDGHIATFKREISSEDIRHELITAANAISRDRESRAQP